MESLNIFIRSIFIDNMVFAFFFGMCSYIAVSKSVKTALGTRRRRYVRDGDDRAAELPFV